MNYKLFYIFNIFLENQTYPNTNHFDTTCIFTAKSALLLAASEDKAFIWSTKSEKVIDIYILNHV